MLKEADLNYLVQGGQLYWWPFHFSNGSLEKETMGVKDFENLTHF
jgi:hypothetical protein